MARREGFLQLRVGPMFVGKTEALIRLARQARWEGRVFRVFKHAWDTRYAGEGFLSSHNGGTYPAVAITSADDLLEKLPPGVEVVILDEVHFFDERLPTVVADLLGRGVDVTAAGLDLNFRGEPFGPMPQLQRMAKKEGQLIFLTATCAVCGGMATRSQRLIDGKPAHYDDQEVRVGADELYQPRCERCHEIPGRP